MATSELNIYDVLTLVQKQLNVPKNNRNYFGNYNYRSCEDICEAIKPVLSSTNSALFIKDEMVEVGGRVYVKATATFRYKDESIEATAFAREDENKKGMDASQLTGATSSYARKYALNGLFLLDDNKDADTENFAEQTENNSSNSKAQFSANCNKTDNVSANTKTGSQKGSKTAKQAFWDACMAAGNGDKAEATKISEQMLAELGHKPTDEDFEEMSKVLV